MSGLLAHIQLLHGGAAPPNPAYMFTATGGSTTGVTITSGGQHVAWAVSGSGDSIYLRTGTVISGKTYCEFAATVEPLNMTRGFGVQESPIDIFYNGNANGGHIFKGNGGCGLAASGYYNGTSGTSSGSYSFATGDRIGIAFDPATRKLWFSKNGAWISGDPALGTGQTMTLAGGSSFYFTMGCYSCTVSGATVEYEIYPNAATQTYAAPSGFSPYQP